MIVLSYEHDLRMFDHRTIVEGNNMTTGVYIFSDRNKFRSGMYENPRDINGKLKLIEFTIIVESPAISKSRNQKKKYKHNFK